MTDQTTPPPDDALPQVDTPGLDLKLLGNISLHLGSVVKHLDTQAANAERARQSRMARQPNFIQLLPQIVTTAATPPVVRFEPSPSMGRQFDLRSIMCAPVGNEGSTPGNAVTVGWYIAPLVTVGTAPPTSTLKWLQNPTPATTKIGPGQLIIPAGQHLYAVVFNPGAPTGAGVQWVVSAEVADEPLRAAKAVSTVE